METGQRTVGAGARLVAALIFAALIFAASGCGKQAEKSGRMVVAASIAPLADFCREVGGDRVRVEPLVPPGSNPHTYQLRPDQMDMLNGASVLVLNGAGLEFWADKAVDAAGNPRLVVVRTAEGLHILDHTEQGGNPHVWLDPVNAIHQVNAIRDAFIKADPAHAANYRANAARYVEALKQLDGYIRSQVKTFKLRSFVAFHPTWVYFAHRYGLDDAATIESSPGKEPSPTDIRHAIEVARKLHVKAIFAEPQVYPKAADVVAEEVGAKVVMLNAFGEPPRYQYIPMMRANIRAMAEAMR